MFFIILAVFTAGKQFAYPENSMGVILDGKRVAAAVRREVKERVAQLLTRYGQAPGLATILVGDDPVSRVYVATKEKACHEVGIQSFAYRLPASSTTAEVMGVLAELNGRHAVHGILLQLPLPAHLDEARLLEALAPEKDVDGLHPLNQGKLLTGKDGLRPCTPLGVMRLLEESDAVRPGKKAVVIGRSTLVGKPVALLLLERHCTVT
ncbi:MAG: bifunctional 5,10-methylenetetrahydrofolate dehydrogenase/5,10-methenyltetrahydrofolate cyclohydrolase, partial [Candidatus Binatia bacterium]|nr:bifunctional 5,10-methylenetetrahydrofolate dehydrogenase/5,10-methenyltetrahydrofolate cyclohydrolase [Candidatus Binatia bacterium]